MPAQTQLYQATMKPLAFLVLVTAYTKASPIPQSIGAREMGVTSPNENLMTVKNILEWLFAAAAVIVVFSIVMWRVRFLRTRNRPLRDFFTFIEAPQQRGSSSPWSMRPNLRPRGSGLTPIPLGRQRVGRTRATDTDSGGRRLGGPDLDDTNGDVTEKDVLPAYEVKGSPPNYSQLMAVDLGTATNTRLQVTETVVVGTTFPRSQPVETSSGTTNSSTQPSHGSDVQLPHPPPFSYNPISATIHPIMPLTNP